MNENINLCEILKDCPKGTKFYSSILGEVTFCGIDWDVNVIKIIDNKKSDWYIRHDGYMIICSIVTDEIILFPSKNQRDWSKFKAPRLKKPKFDPKTLKPYDKILVKCTSIYDSKLVWRPNFFSYLYEDEEDSSIRVYTIPSEDNSPSMYAIPYNEETKHLVNTMNEAPEFYRYWEE